MTKFMIATLLVSSWFAHPNLDSREIPLSKDETIVAMFQEMNEKRVRAGLPEMVLDEELCALSQRWSKWQRPVPFIMVAERMSSREVRMIQWRPLLPGCGLRGIESFSWAEAHASDLVPNKVLEAHGTGPELFVECPPADLVRDSRCRRLTSASFY